MKSFCKIIFLLIITNCYSQKDSFNYFFEHNIKKIDSLFSRTEKTCMTKKITNFNFLKMEIIEGDINENDFYIAYYNINEEIIQLDKVNKSNEFYANYSLIFKKVNDLITHIYIKYKSENHLSNKIIFNYKKEELFAFKFYNLFKREVPNVQIDEKTSTSTINFIYLLDKQLKTKSKSKFHEGYMTVFSEIKTKENIRVEKLQTYSTFCSQSENLKNIHFKRFIGLLYFAYGNGDGSGVYLTATPRQKKGIPLLLTDYNDYE